MIFTRVQCLFLIQVGWAVVFYPFIGALCFILTFILLGISGMIVLMHKADNVKYTIRRGGVLAVIVTLGGIALLGTVYCIYGSLNHI
ncbi:hypothetical protein DXF86_17355 [Citrobacter freundii]|nr:hypothetical protein SS33_04170 [Enterobacter kobei]RDT14096.1 hypothetical protein DXF84_10535 [Escherichia coli]RDT38391.1 hypothetical protein DXF86_17355 [Citrobacter freundii]HBX3134350.1 hypothetical protein [Klebsiella pneumoniae]HBX4538921.1 hypothetical protein [Klebsiella pneumoniae]